jgi:hypothetical protein
MEGLRKSMKPISRPVLSPEKASQDEEQRNFLAKERKKLNSVMGPQRGARHQDMLTDRLSVVK